MRWLRGGERKKEGGSFCSRLKRRRLLLADARHTSNLQLHVSGVSRSLCVCVCICVSAPCLHHPPSQRSPFPCLFRPCSTFLCLFHFVSGSYHQHRLLFSSGLRIQSDPVRFRSAPLLSPPPLSPPPLCTVTEPLGRWETD